MGRVLENRAAVALLAVLLIVGSASLTGTLLQRGTRAESTPGAGCRLANGVRHVIYIQFDNVHFTRDAPDVPSDLEQMPHLLGFLQQQGTLLTENHTPLISHTGGDLLSSLTGLYPDGHGQGVSNSWRYFNPDGSTGGGNTFTYWTSRVYDTRVAAPTDTTYNLLTSSGRNLPAPWVAFTQAGCDVGSAAGPAGMVLENVAADVTTVFGGGSPQAEEALHDPVHAYADLVGVAVHCARGSSTCSPQRSGRPDRLPDEPGGYDGFNALYGHRDVVSALGAQGPITDLDGNLVAGFPGFDAMTPAVSLAYLAAMQEHGIPVTYAYISDAHDPRGGGRAFGPGETGYVEQLREYDAAFGRFFQRLAGDGIDSTNTLFVLSADEGDHFVGGPPAPAGCDGVRTPCTYRQTGEVHVNLPGLLEQQGVHTAFGIHSDSAPAIWVDGDPGPAQPAVRGLELAAGRLLVGNPYTGATEPLAAYLADRAEMRLLHMVSADPARTPTFVLFARPDYFVSSGPPACVPAGCVSVDPASAYNHGDVQADITTTWLGLAGPGVARRGLDHSTWADQVDVRPTLLALTGLRDPYRHDGRVLSEVIEPPALPAGIRGSRPMYERLAAGLKQLNAPVGRLGLLSLAAASRAIMSESAGDADYTAHLSRWDAFTARRDALAARMLDMLNGAAFAGAGLETGAAEQALAEASALTTSLEGQA